MDTTVAGIATAHWREGSAAPLRILLISNMWPSAADPTFGSFVDRHVTALRDAGAQVTVVANEQRRSGGTAFVRKYASLLRRSRRAARSGDFDIVCGHYLYPTAFIARAAARRAGVPYVLVAHGTDVNSLRRTDPMAWASRRAVGGAALLVAVSRDLARRARGDLQVSPAVPIEVANMGVDTELFRPDKAARQRSGLPASDRLLLFVGNLVASKGVDVLLSSFRLLQERGQADRLVIIGSGPLEDSLRTQVAQHVVRSEGADDDPGREAVTFLGAVPHEELPSWMAAADVLVLPSRREGLGLVLLEAMACGTPCVASRVGGIPEILGEDCGELVEPDDPGSLANAIATVLANGKTQYAAACRRVALQNTVDAQARRFLDLVGDVLGST